MKSVISVVIPAYNVEKYIEKCVRSVMRQEYSELEIILVDDGATDNTGKICDKLAREDKRIKVFHKKNGGLSDARNFGIKKASGEIVACVDGDDYVNKKYIGDMYAAMIESGADVAVCGYNDVIPREMKISGREATVKLLTQQEDIDIVAWNKLYKKRLFVDNDIWFPIGKKHEDTLTMYKILSKADKVAYVAETLYSYVDRKGSITSEERVEERLEAREEAAKEAVKYFKKDNDLKQAAEVSVLLAKYAYLDCAIAGKIGRRYGEVAKEWIKNNALQYKNNKYLSKKLKIYNIMSTKMGGVMYWMFRKIKHE